MTFIISIKQVVIMFLLMGIGYFCSQIKLIGKTTARDMTNLLLYIVSPCLIINAFLQKFSLARLKLFFVVLVAVILLFILSILVARLLFSKKRHPEPQIYAPLHYGVVYSNAGFMGIPLVQAILGQLGVFFAIPYLVVYNMFVWTQGIGLFKKHPSLKHASKEVLLNPNTIASALGLIIFVTQFKFPSIVLTTMHHITSLNTPLSMIIIGTNLSAIKWKRIGRDPLVWRGVLAKNLIIPAIMVIILAFMPLSQTAYLTTIIMIACPTAGLVVLFSLLNHYELEFPTQFLCLSTLFSVVSLPLIIFFANFMTNVNLL